METKSDIDFIVKKHLLNDTGLIGTFIFILLILFTGYLSFFGIETKSFNNLLQFLILF